MMQYQILTNNKKRFELAKRSAKVVKALRALQVSSSYYDEAERYTIAKNARLLDWIVSEDEDAEKDRVIFEMKEPTLSAEDFLIEVSKLFFPDAKITPDDVDIEVAEEALQAFLNFTEPRRLRVNNLLSLLGAFQAAQTSSIAPETAAAES